MKNDVKGELDSLARQKRLNERAVTDVLDRYLRSVAEGIMDESDTES